VTHLPDEIAEALWYEFTPEAPAMIPPAPDDGPRLRELALILAVAEAADAYIAQVNPGLSGCTGPWPDLIDAVYDLRRHRDRARVRAREGR
jgi:hypothetical protein